MEKILVYGASGDQGIPLVNSLLKKGYKVRAVTRNPAVSYTHLTLPTNREV